MHAGAHVDSKCTLIDVRAFGGGACARAHPSHSKRLLAGAEIVLSVWGLHICFLLHERILQNMKSCGLFASFRHSGKSPGGDAGGALSAQRQVPRRRRRLRRRRRRGVCRESFKQHAARVTAASSPAATPAPPAAAPGGLPRILQFFAA